MIQLPLKFLLDDVPSVLCMGDDTPGAVLKACRENAEVAGAGQEEERAVAEKA